MFMYYIDIKCLTSQECKLCREGGVIMAGVVWQKQSFRNFLGGKCENGMNIVPFSALFCSSSVNPSPITQTCQIVASLRFNFFNFFSFQLFAVFSTVELIDLLPRDIRFFKNQISSTLATKLQHFIFLLMERSNLQGTRIFAWGFELQKLKGGLAGHNA